MVDFADKNSIDRHGRINHALDTLSRWQAHRKTFLWGKVADPRMSELVLGYMLRTLTRGIMPDPDLIRDTVVGQIPVPSCGYIGCPTKDEHVH